MKKHLLCNTGNFYKANLHVHTNVSDGEMSPEEIKRIYSERGYSIVAYTDHEVMVPHPSLTDGSFLALTSTEISINDRYDCDFCYCKTYHLNIYSPYEGKDCFNTFDKSKIWLSHSIKYITPEQEKMGCERIYTTQSINEVIAKANEEGCLVSYNHPVWSMQDHSDYIDLEGLWGVELYNTGCARNGYLDSTKPLDDLLRRGKNVFPLATDDAHRFADCFGGFVMVRAKELTYGSVFDALKNGDFYASTGSEIYEISIEGGIIRIVSSPVSFVGVCTDCRHLYSKRAEGDVLSETEFDINGYLKLADDGLKKHRYIRVTLMDEKGRAAYSRAYSMAEINNK